VEENAIDSRSSTRYNNIDRCNFYVRRAREQTGSARCFHEADDRPCVSRSVFLSEFDRSILLRSRSSVQFNKASSILACFFQSIGWLKGNTSNTAIARVPSRASSSSLSQIATYRFSLRSSRVAARFSFGQSRDPRLGFQRDALPSCARATLTRCPRHSRDRAPEEPVALKLRAS